MTCCEEFFSANCRVSPPSFLTGEASVFNPHLGQFTAPSIHDRWPPELRHILSHTICTVAASDDLGWRLQRRHSAHSPYKHFSFLRKLGHQSRRGFVASWLLLDAPAGGQQQTQINPLKPPPSLSLTPPPPQRLRHRMMLAWLARPSPRPLLLQTRACLSPYPSPRQLWALLNKKRGGGRWTVLSSWGRW